MEKVTKKGITLSDYTFFDSDLSSTLLHLLKVRVSNGIITAIVLRALVRVAALEAASHIVRVEAALRAALGTSVLVHLLAGFLPHGVHLGHGCIDAGDVLSLVSGLQLAEGSLDFGLLVGR